jgi:4a-hydroxytetrahydrobiopterin dehydratase
MSVLSSEAVAHRLAALPGWAVREGLLTKTFAVRSFAHGVLFIGAVAQLAEAANHHPDVSLRGYNQVTIDLITHSANDLTDRDFDLARAIEALPHKPPKAGP